jgi:hypothetical protein
MLFLFCSVSFCFVFQPTKESIMPLYIIPNSGGSRNIVVLKPKPPKIGSAYCAYDRPQHFTQPYRNTHNPDQDWVQDAMWGFGVRGALRVRDYPRALLRRLTRKLSRLITPNH